MTQEKKDMVDLCRRICTTAHATQQRRNGDPYEVHPIRVSKAFEENHIRAGAALLHDVIEDTEITVDDLLGKGVSLSIVRVVNLLTHDESVDYADYIREIKTDKDARAVKIADIVDNITDLPTAHNIKKYRQALMLLAGV